MERNLNDVFQQAVQLRLKPGERARLVDRLIATLDADPEVDEAWATEVERRQSEIENGTVSLLADSETLGKLKAEFEITSVLSFTIVSTNCGLLNPCLERLNI